MSVEDQMLNERLGALLKKMDMFLGMQIHAQTVDTKKAAQNNLQEFHNRSKKIVSGEDPNKSEVEKLKDVQYENNAYLKKIAENSSKEREERKNAKTKVSPKEFLTSPLESINSLRSTDNVFGSLKNLGKTLDAPGKTVTGSLLQAPSAVLNLFKDVSKTRRLRNISETNKELGRDKEVFSDLSKRLDELKSLPKEKQDSNKIGKLEDILLSIKQSTDAKEERLVKLMASELRRFDKEPKFGDKEIQEDFRRKQEENIRESVKDKNYENRFNQLFNISENLTTGIKENNKTNLRGQTKFSEKPRVLPTSNKGPIPTFSGDALNSLFGYKIPISDSKPTNFAETIGGIFHRLGTLNENIQKPTQQGESGGASWLSAIGPAIMTGIAWLRNKLPSLISSLSGKIRNLFTSMSKKLDGLFSGVKGFFGNATKRFQEMFPKTSNVAKEIAKRGSDILKKLPGISKGLGDGVKVAGSVGGAVLKQAAKRLPILGALYAGVSEAKDVEGPMAKKGTVAAGVTTGSLLGAGGGAMAGAAIGSVVPVVGTLIGGIAGAIIGGFGGEKLGKYISSGLFDAFSKENKEIRDSGTVTPSLKTERELERASDKSAEMKLQEIALYNALKKHSAEDLDMNGRKRAFLQANAMNQELSQ